MKGTDVPAEITGEGKDDYELYTWKKLSPATNADDKAIVESYFLFGDDVLHHGKKLEHLDGLKYL